MKGKDAEPQPLYGFLATDIRSAVESIAVIEDRDISEVLTDLVGDALAARAADMIRNHSRLQPKELRKLKVLMRLFEKDVLVESPPPAPAARKVR